MKTRDEFARNEGHRSDTPESPENFHNKREHSRNRDQGPGMERTLDRSQNMDRDLEQDPNRDLDQEQLDPEFDGEDDLGRDEDYYREGMHKDVRDEPDNQGDPGNDPGVRGI